MHKKTVNEYTGKPLDLNMFPSSKLEKALSSSSQADARRKYLTGEWFYEAKSRRHMDKIHGSEIILASMKQRKAGSGVFTLHC